MSAIFNFIAHVFTLICLVFLGSYVVFSILVSMPGSQLRHYMIDVLTRDPWGFWRRRESKEPSKPLEPRPAVRFTQGSPSQGDVPNSDDLKQDPPAVPLPRPFTRVKR